MREELQCAVILSKLTTEEMSEAEEKTSRESLDKDAPCYLAWKMDWKFREILNKKTPNYLQHLKALPSHDATDSIYQRAKWSHRSTHPPQIHNFFKKLKGFSENPDCKSDVVSDTDSVRTEDFENRFTELLVPAPSVGSESQDTLSAEIGDGTEIDDCNDITTGKELLECVYIENTPVAANIDCSNMHKWKTPAVDKQRCDSMLMIPNPKSFIKEKKVKSSGIKEDVSNDETQKIEHLVAENIKLSAEKVLLIEELKEVKEKREFTTAFKLKKLQEDCSRLRADNQMLRANCTELECRLNDQSKTVSELTQQNTQYSNQTVQLENNNKLLIDNISELNKQLEQNAQKIGGLQNQFKDLKGQLYHEKELCQKQNEAHLRSMTTLEKQSKESLEKLQNDYQHELEKLKNASNAERDALMEKYELRLARQVAAQTSQNAIKESQISSLKSKLIKVEFEQECEKQKWKQILAKNEDAMKKKPRSQQSSTELNNQQPQNNNHNAVINELQDKLERANKQILNLNTMNQQLYIQIGNLREELSKVREINKDKEERAEIGLEISETRDILAQQNQLMIQELKDKITKEMHIEVLSLMQRLHQQEDELVYIKSIWNKMLESLHLFEHEGNNSAVFGMDKLEILITGLLNEESHLNMNILGITHLSRLSKSVCGKAESGKCQSPLTDKATLAQYLQEPIKTAFSRLHSTTQQLRDLVKSLSKTDLQNPSLQLYPTRQTDSIHSEFTMESADQENSMFRPFFGISSSSSADYLANGFDEESQRMILLECDLNHQAKVLLELMRSYNGLQEALVASHSSLQVQKERSRNNTTK